MNLSWITKTLFKKPQSFPDLVVPAKEIYIPTIKIAAGKWVVCNKRVGIVAAVIGFPSIEVHLTNEAGETVEVVSSTVHLVRLARYMEIPEARRPADAAYAAAFLGYV